MTADLLAQALERIADPKNTHFAGDAQVVAREALAAHRSQAPAEGDAAPAAVIPPVDDDRCCYGGPREACGIPCFRRRAGRPNVQPKGMPAALYLSWKQVQGVVDGTFEPAGSNCLPFRREPEGLFTVPVYLAASDRAHYIQGKTQGEEPVERIMRSAQTLVLTVHFKQPREAQDQARENLRAVVRDAIASSQAPAPAAGPVPAEVDELLRRFERQAQRFGELWERCQGKGWPEPEYTEFGKIRDERLPALKQQIRAALQAPAVVADAECSTWRALCEFLLRAEEPMPFLHAWNEGDFDACKRGWPEAPASVYPAASVEPDEDRLRKFLYAAAGEGFVLDGVDAGELFMEQFPDYFEASHPPVQHLDAKEQS